MSDPNLDTMAWEFLDSQYAGVPFTGWPIDSRLDAYLRRRGLTQIADDGTLFVSLLEQVMTNIALKRQGAHPNLRR